MVCAILNDTRLQTPLDLCIHLLIWQDWPAILSTLATKLLHINCWRAWLIAVNCANFGQCTLMHWYVVGSDWLVLWSALCARPVGLLLDRRLRVPVSWCKCVVRRVYRCLLFNGVCMTVGLHTRPVSTLTQVQSAMRMVHADDIKAHAQLLSALAVTDSHKLVINAGDAFGADYLLTVCAEARVRARRSCCVAVCAIVRSNLLFLMAKRAHRHARVRQQCDRHVAGASGTRHRRCCPATSHETGT
jgi:hypothetical protein